MDTNVKTISLNRPGYLMTVRHETDDNSYISSIIRLPGDDTGGAVEGDTIFTSFPQSSLEAAEKAAQDYFAQLNK